MLGQAPAGPGRVNLVLAILRARQIWGGTHEPARAARGAGPGRVGRRPGATPTRAEEQARALVEAMEDAAWRPGGGPAAAARAAPEHSEAVAACWTSPPARSCPGWRRPPTRSTTSSHALDGGFVPAGPSGSPLRGLVNVLPTGRNFYSVDPKAIPSRLAWETGQALADSLLERYRADNGDWPASVGLSLWGTSAMRTSGDDIAEALALLGVRPVWDDASRRVTGLEADPARRAGPAAHRRHAAHLRLLPRRLPARRRPAGRRRTAGRRPGRAGRADNYVGAHARADLAEHGDERRATTRIFGSRPAPTAPACCS